MGSIFHSGIQYLGSGITPIELTKAEYDALPTSEKENPAKVYYVKDYDPSPADIIDDTTTALDKVWSSSKTASEIAECIEVETGTITSSYTKAFEGLYKCGKVVNCTFQLSGVTTSRTFANIATIPVGFRPKNFIIINGCRGDNQWSRMTVFPTNGNISVAAQLSNENIFFSTCWITD